MYISIYVYAQQGKKVFKLKQNRLRLREEEEYACMRAWLVKKREERSFRTRKKYVKYNNTIMK